MPVAACDKRTVIGHDEYGHGSVDDVLRMAYAVLETAAFVYKGSDQFCRIDFSGTHGHELMAVFLKVFFHQVFGIVDLAHRGDGVKPQM